MTKDLSAYKDLYIQISRESLQSLNKALLTLEKNPDDQDAIEEVFRSAHTLRTQSDVMGYSKTGFLCHAIADVFFEITEGRLKLTPEVADYLFICFDSLTASIDKIERESEEVDLSSQVERLKKLTGVRLAVRGLGK